MSSMLRFPVVAGLVLSMAALACKDDGSPNDPQLVFFCDDGMVLVKFFLHIDQATQLERFKAREKDPVKNFKIGPDDWRNRKKWPEYEQAIGDMFDRTHRPDAPWVAIAANHKRHARLSILRRCVEALEP